MAVKKKKQIKKKPGKKLRKSVGVAMIILLLLAVFVVAAALASEIFRVSQITVEGNVVLSAQDVIQASGVELGTSMLEIRPNKIMQTISAHPRLIANKVTRKLPSTVHLAVSERKEFAYTRQQNKTIVLDENCTIISITEGASQLPELVFITGLSVSGYTAGSSIGVRDEIQLTVLKNVLALLQQSPHRADITTIDIKNPLDIRLTTTHSIIIRIGFEEDFLEKIRRAFIVIEKLLQESITDGVVDVTSNKAALYSPPRQEELEPSLPIDEGAIDPNNPESTQAPAQTPESGDNENQDIQSTPKPQNTVEIPYEN